MTRDLFYRLYRQRHCRRVSSTAAKLPDPDLRPASVNVRMALEEGRAPWAERHFQTLLRLPSAEQEQEIEQQTADVVRLLERWHGQQTLTLLHDWALRCPASPWPRALEIIYWRERWREVRGHQASDELPPVQWGDLNLLTELLYRQCMALLGQSPLDWLVAEQLLLIEPLMEAPEWVEEWCRSGSTCGMLERTHLLEAASPILLPLGLADAWWPEMPSALPELLRDAAKDASRGQLLGSRGLYLALKTAPYGLSALMNMARSRLEVDAAHLQPQLVALANAHRLPSAAVAAIESLFWLASFYALVQKDRDQKSIVTVGERYERTLPLSEEGRSGIALALYDWWFFQDSQSRNPFLRYRNQWQRYRRALRLLAGDPSVLTLPKLHRLIPIWLACGREAVWFRPLVEAQRHRDPFAAVLYGVLCDNGWAGLIQNHDTATAWYRYAADLSPPGGIKHFTCANCMEEPFSQVILRLSQEGDAPELWRALCFAADAGYSDAQYRRGLFMSVNPDRFSLNDAQAWVCRSLRRDQKDTFVAHYHLALLYDDRIDRVDAERIAGTTAQSRAAKAIEHYLAFLTLFLTRSEDYWREEDLNQIERAMMYGVICLCNTPEITPLYLQAFHRVLVRYREELHQTSALAALALLYGRDESPMHDYASAVRIIESLRQLRDDNDMVLGVYHQLQQQNPERFARLAGHVLRDDLPACHPITPPSPLNPF